MATDAERLIARVKAEYSSSIETLIARAILLDISDRRGWKHALAETDPEVLEEVIDAWEAIVTAAMGSPAPPDEATK